MTQGAPSILLCCAGLLGCAVPGPEYNDPGGDSSEQSVSDPAPPDAWWSDDPDLLLALRWAAEALCEATAGADCPEVDSDGYHMVRWSEPGEDAEALCGQAKLTSFTDVVLSESLALAPVCRGPILPQGSSRTRLPNVQQQLGLIVAHELGHFLWGPEHVEVRGHLMQAEAGDARFVEPLLVSPRADSGTKHEGLRHR